MLSIEACVLCCRYKPACCAPAARGPTMQCWPVRQSCVIRRGVSRTPLVCQRTDLSQDRRHASACPADTKPPRHRCLPRSLVSAAFAEDIRTSKYKCEGCSECSPWLLTWSCTSSAAMRFNLVQVSEVFGELMYGRAGAYACSVDSRNAVSNWHAMHECHQNRYHFQGYRFFHQVRQTHRH